MMVTLDLSQIARASGDRLLIEGFLGELEEIGMIEGIMLKVRGTNGVLRMDLMGEELKKAL